MDIGENGAWHEWSDDWELWVDTGVKAEGMGTLDTSITARIELTLAGEFRLDLGGISAGITADMPIVAEKRVITGDKSTALDMRLTKINLVRERYIRDMENLTVSEIEDITVEQVCCYRIV